MISVRNLGVTLGEELVLSDLTLEVGPNELVAVMGPSGCGKTTLLRAIAGYVPIIAGEIRINDQMPEVYRRVHHISVVFQRYSNIGWMNALDNVAAAITYVSDRKSRRQLAGEYLAEVGLQDSAHKYMRQLSGGMQQRVALARSMAQRSEILLLDEPFAALDSITRFEICGVFQSLLAKHPRTVILVTHSASNALMLADQVVVVGGRPAKVVGRLPIQIKDRSTECQQTLRESIESMMRAAATRTIIRAT